ncbi:MAG: SDR family oxidoreductase, partial [Alphaproteobacteria bacterium]|nr:SDR family oxidoreductase [Alphaproteobacteria bacterium]
MQGQSVIVTGGASGIGRATALLLAREGARIFIGDVDEAGGRHTAAQASAENLEAEFLPLDLTDPRSIASFAAAVLQRCGRIHGLVNGAGWDQIQPFLENPPEMWDRVVAINLMGAVRLTRSVLEPMVAARAGKIVTISSDAGRVGSMGETVYAAAKGGLIAFTKSLAREVARYRIHVNCVCPGPTDTPLFQGQPERMREALTRA